MNTDLDQYLLDQYLRPVQLKAGLIKKRQSILLFWLLRDQIYNQIPLKDDTVLNLHNETHHTLAPLRYSQ